jgi:hypothetical protein
MLPGDGDQIRLLARAGGEDGTEPDDPGDPDGGEPAPDYRQDITDPATGLSRLLSERCSTCILHPGDLMHLGPGRTAAFIRQVLDAGSYVVCHATLTYGDFPDYGPAICRGFFDASGGGGLAGIAAEFFRLGDERRRDLGQAAARLQDQQVPGPLAVRVFDGNSPQEAYQHVLRGIEDGDPAVLDASRAC